MNIKKALVTIRARRGKFSLECAVNESVGPDAWPNDDSTTRQIVAALVLQDATMLGDALLENASQYLTDIAEDITTNPVSTEIDAMLDDLGRLRDLKIRS